jgi:cell division protein FtsQ
VASRRGARPARALPLVGVSALARALRAMLAFVWERRRARLALLIVLGSMPFLAGGWLWLRQSSFVAVRQVQIAGVHGPQARAIEDALTSAAHRMSTLALNAAALRAAVAGYPVVREMHARARFPHGLRITVVEQQPVAAMVVGGARTAVAADGAVLGTALLSSTLPGINGYRELAAGQRVHDTGLLGFLAVLGAAPAPIRRAVTRVYTSAQGLTVAMRNGLLVYFGDAARPHAKWLSLDSVMADSSSQGASYVDVRIPSRPAAGFPAGVQPPAQAASEGSSAPIATQANASESTVASIAAALAGANNGTPSPASGATPPTGTTTPTETAPQSPSAPSEASGEPSQTSTTAGG